MKGLGSLTHGLLLTALLAGCRAGAEPPHDAPVEYRSAAPGPVVTSTMAATASARARCTDISGRLEQVAAAVTDAMEQYDGHWGFALIDVDCGEAISVPEVYVQYPASAGKIVPVVAALRAVDAGTLPMEAIEEDLLLTLTISSDASADYLSALVDQEAIAAVLKIAQVSPSTTFGSSWREAFMTPLDLARVWAALLRGDLLSAALTERMLALSGTATFPDGAGYDTFPPAIDVEGLAYGQKPGYLVDPFEPDVLVGAGFLRPAGKGGPAGWAAVLMVTTEMDDVYEPVRRSVFPLVLDFALGELEGSTHP